MHRWWRHNKIVLSTWRSIFGEKLDYLELKIDKDCVTKHLPVEGARAVVKATTQPEKVDRNCYIAMFCSILTQQLLTVDAKGHGKMTTLTLIPY